jgi:Mce-associated membrane protein
VIKRAAPNDVFEQLVAELDPDRPSESVPKNGDKPAESARVDAETATSDQSVDDDDTAHVESTDNDNAEATPEAGEADSVEAEDPPSRLRRLRRVISRLAPIVAGLIAVGVLAGSAFLGWQLKQRVDDAAAGKAALEAARNYAVTLSTMNSNDIDKDIAHVLDGATGEFKSMYGHASAQLRQLLVDNKAVSHGTVVDAAIKSVTNNKVEVMLFVDQSVSNAVNPEPRIDRLRMVMTMEKVDQRWLASNLDIE